MFSLCYKSNKSKNDLSKVILFRTYYLSSLNYFLYYYKVYLNEAI